MAQTPGQQEQPTSTSNPGGRGSPRTWLRVFVLVLVTLLLIGVALLQWFPAEALRPWLEEQLSARLGRPVTIESLQIAPLRGFELTNARIGERVGDAPDDLRVKTLEFSFDPWKLAKGELHVRALRASGIELLIKQADVELPVFPCTTLHVEAALDRALVD